MIEIRPFDPSRDAGPLAPLIAEHDRHYGGPEPALADVERQLQTLPAGVEILLALGDRQQPVGFASFSFLFPALSVRPLLYLKELYVGTASRRGGVGRALMNALARIARERGCARLEWTTSQDNEAARAFYDKLGAETLPSKISYRFEGEALDRMASTDESDGGDPQL